MELERSLESFRHQGLGVVAISYDEPAVIRHYAARAGGFSYPLLADPSSEIIRAFGIVNHNFGEDSDGHGMAFPGTFMVDGDGRVVEKFFESMHRQRFTAETVLLKTQGVGGGRRTEVRSEQIAFAAFASQDVVRPGNRITLQVEVELPEGMHLYAPGNDTYRPVGLTLADHPMIQSDDAVLPDPEILFLPVIDEKVPVYRDRMTLTRDVTLSPRLEGEQFVIEATFDYQVCSDEICYTPTRHPLAFELTVEQHDVERVPEALRRENRVKEAPAG